MRPKASISSIGVWLMGSVLLLLLGVAAFLAYQGLTFGTVQVPAAGYIAMALGVLFSLAVGIGLMALLFYSSRGGYDEPPRLISDATGDGPENRAGSSAPHRQQ